MSLPISQLFLALAVGHAVADYPLQGDFLAKAKNHRAPIAGIDWGIALAMHSLIHAGMVWGITGNLRLGVAEFLAHLIIDFAKCEGLIDFRIDQGLHLGCKVLWVALVATSG